MKLKLYLFTLALLCQFLIYGQTIDQQNSPEESSILGTNFPNAGGQSFTAGLTGTLTQIDLKIESNDFASTVQGFDLIIYEGNGYSGNVLNTTEAYFPLTYGPNQISFTLANSGITITTGTMYTLRLIMLENFDMDTSITFPGTYANGGLYFQEGSTGFYNLGDMWFITYVTTGPDAPTASAQSFCSGATVVDLVATGTDLKWYTTETDNTVLVNTTELSSATYYVSQTVDGIESERTSVSVTINGVPHAPTANSVQIYTGQGTIADLTATGTGLLWYDAAINGTSLDLSDSLVDGTTYYVSQTTTCGESLKTVITVKEISEASQAFCGSATVENLTSTPSADATVKWYSDATGGTALDNTTALGTGTYYVEQETPTTVTTLASGFLFPHGVAIQADGKIVVADTYNDEVKRMDADGSNIEILGSDLDRPRGVAIQSDGKIVVVGSSGSNSIKRMNADGSNIEILGSGFVSLSAVAIQADGKIVVADTQSDEIKRMDANGFNIETLGSGFNSPFGVAIQTDGKILVANYHANDNTVKRMNADGSNIETLGSGFSSPSGVAVQADGKIVVTELSNNSIKRMNADGTGIEILGNGFAAPTGLTIQANGDILVADGEFIKRITEGLSNRVAVSVIINEVPDAPTVDAQAFCGSATVANLASGSSSTTIWYNVETEGSALEATTALATGTYYVSEVNANGCESERTSVSVTINEAPTVTIEAETASFCAQEDATITATATESETSIDFQGGYAPSNWSSSTFLSDGFVDETNAPSSIQIWGGNTGSGNLGDTEYSIQCILETTISFSWNYASGGSASDDYPLVRISGAPTLFNGFDQNGSSSQSGTMTITVPANSYFTFTMRTLTNQNGGANVTISNFVTSTSTSLSSYAWTATDGGTITGSTTNASITPETSGTYTVTATASNGCTATDSVAVTISDTEAPTAEAQAFCGSATVADLAPDSSSTIIWYSEETEGSALETTTALATGTYYVSEVNANGCESERTEVSITINEIPDAPTAATQTFCGSATVADLEATDPLSRGTGNILNWYATETSETVLTETTALATGTYYVSISNGNGCESERISVSIYVDAIPDAPTADSQSFCESATVADLTPASDEDIQWFTSETEGSSLSDSTQLTTGTYYVAAVSLNGCESERTSVAVTINTIPEAPTTSGSTAGDDIIVTMADGVCSDFSGLYTYIGLLNGKNNYQYVDISDFKIGFDGMKWVFYVNNDLNDSGFENTSPVTTSLLPPTTGWSATMCETGALTYSSVMINSQTFCSAATVADLDATGANILWYSSETEDIALDPTTAVTNGTYYASQTVSGCESERTSVSVTVSEFPDAPTVSTPITYNEGDVADALTATTEGSGLLWYATETEGTGDTEAPTPSTNTVGSTSYWVSSINDNGCESERVEIVVTVEEVLGIGEAELMNSIRVYPNPTNGLLTISNTMESELQVSVYDINGRLLLNKNCDQETTTIDISNFNNGIYLLKMKTEFREISKRVIKK